MSLYEHPDQDIFSKNHPIMEEINVLALVKGSENYIFFYTDQYRNDILRTLGRFASNPDLSFTWYDAAVLSQRIRADEQENL